jgi:hypothetical protein
MQSVKLGQGIAAAATSGYTHPLSEVCTVKPVVRSRRTEPWEFFRVIAHQIRPDKRICNLDAGEGRIKAALPPWRRGSGNYNIGLKINSLHDDLIDDSKFEGSLTAVLRDYQALLCRVTRSMFAVYLHEQRNCFQGDTRVSACQRLAHEILQTEEYQG